MKKLLYLLLFIILPFAVISQNIKGGDLRIKKKSRLIGQVTIGSKSFDNSAILTLTATDRGLLIPRLTTAERDAIGSPTNGLMIYNTDDGEFQFFEGVWMSVGGGMGIADSSFITLQTDTNKAFNNPSIQFADDVFFQNPVQINSTFTVNLAQSIFKGVSATGGNFALLVVNSVGTDLLNVRNDGNVGIGVAAPFTSLHVKAPGTTSSLQDIAFFTKSDAFQTGISIRATQSAAEISAVNFGAVNGRRDLILSYQNSSSVRTEGIRITGDGDVGISISVPTEKLEVNGNIKCDTLFSAAINIFSVSNTIFSAAVLTLNGTPVTIVSAPGIGKAIEVVSVTMRMIFNTTAYATNTTLRVITATAQDQQASEGRLLLSTGSRILRGTIAASGPGTTNTQLVANQALIIDVVTGNPTAGDGDIVYYVTYRIITL